MARIIIDNRRRKTVQDSSANCERRRKLENSASNDGTTTVGADVDNGCGDGDKRRVPNKVTRLAKKFNSTTLNEKQKEEPLQQQHRPHQQQRVCKQQINQQRISAICSAGNAGDCRVKETVRLFETDTNCAKGNKSVGEGGAGARTSTSVPFRRRASNWNEATKDEGATPTGLENEKTNGGNGSGGAAIDNTLTSPPIRLKPPELLASVVVGEKRETEKKDDGDGKSANGRRCCVSMLVKDTRTYASFDVRSLKNRPLSLATQNFHLESSSNDAAESSQEQRTCTADATNASPAALSWSLSKNTSFLHRSKTSVAADGASRDRNLIDATAADDVYGYSNIDELRCSFSSPTLSSSSSSSSCHSFSSASCLPHLSSHTRTRVDSQFTRVNSHDYEEGDGDGDGIDVDSNVYDTVLYSELNMMPQPQMQSPDEDEHYENVAQIVGDDDECSVCSTQVAYEVVSSLSYAAVDSDSSLEKTNSLYETKETTRTSQSKHFTIYLR